MNLGGIYEDVQLFLISVVGGSFYKPSGCFFHPTCIFLSVYFLSLVSFYYTYKWRKVTNKIYDSMVKNGLGIELSFCEAITESGG